MEEKEIVNSSPLEGEVASGPNGTGEPDGGKIENPAPPSPAQTQAPDAGQPPLDGGGYYDKYLRALAELENTRRRAAMDAQAAGRARAISIAESFLPLIDAIGAALGHQPENKDFISFMLAANGALESAGIKKIESVGQMLNPALHNAIQTEQSDAPAGAIVRELQSGYTLGDAVLRPAMVIVAK
jgi:molecular chaperone GrpE